MITKLRDIEAAFAAEAEAHARAALELNPHGEAEALELGAARAVYAGQWSQVHGVFGLGLDGLTVIAPVGFLDMTRLLGDCAAVLTDSGGVQKEAYFHRKPCVTLRSETEWVETIECGWNRLWTEPAYRPWREITDYGDGRAAQAILHRLREGS